MQSKERGKKKGNRKKESNSIGELRNRIEDEKP